MRRNRTIFSEKRTQKEDSGPLFQAKTGILREKNRIQAKKTEKEATLYVYDEISFWGINQQDFAQDLDAIGDDIETIHVRISSPGGDVFQAKAMAALLQQHPARTIAHIDSIAASAASTLALACDEVEMADTAFFMIHNAMMYVDFWGYFNVLDIEALKKELENSAQILGKIDGSIVKIYMNKTGKPEEEIKALMAAETWFNAEEALEAGFADRIFNLEEKVENNFDLSGFKNAPDFFSASKHTNKEPKKEEGQGDPDQAAALLRSLEIEAEI